MYRSDTRSSVTSTGLYVSQVTIAWSKADRGIVGRELAIGGLVLNGMFKVKGIRVVRTPTRLEVAMPKKANEHGLVFEIAHPIHREVRGIIEQAVLLAYHESLSGWESKSKIPATIPINRVRELSPSA